MFRLLDGLNLLTKRAGLFAAEGVLKSLGKSILVRIIDQHGAPRENLDRCVRAAYQMQASKNG